VRRIHPNLVEDQRDHILVLRIDREEALGALSRSMLESLASYLEEVAVDPTVRVVVLTGTGRGFIAGADIGEYDGASFEEFVAYQRLGRLVFDRIARLPQPVIAAVNGYALGGGFEVALSCDFRFATERAKFGLPEIKLGLLPGGSGTQRLPRLIGASRAAELIMTGRSMTADEAYRVGVLTGEPTSTDGLLPAALELAASIATAAPQAVRAAKALIRDGLDLPLESGWALEQATLAELAMSSDGREGVRAFVEKRAPVFGS
jgi:enoyl-CoA hydratase